MSLCARLQQTYSKINRVTSYNFTKNNLPTGSLNSRYVSEMIIRDAVHVKGFVCVRVFISEAGIGYVAVKVRRSCPWT